ncbi:hypothetical protein [Planctomicrobium sp. SH664]|uniref:hypothetical protein n=1 Tax=Planctomicrobium sp. SH664 TaxID=3448125 RepID=UPI003F5C466E
MSSPFTVFRRYDRVFMVVVTGLALLTFVLGDAVSDPSRMNTKMIVLFLAASVGVVAWLSGMGKGKGTEWGLSGALIGAAVGLVITYYTREPSVIYMQGGNLSAAEVSQLRRQRHVANQFMQLAFHESAGDNQFDYYYHLPRYLFSFGSRNGEVSDEEIALGEVLRREADKLGIVVTEEAVIEYLNELTRQQLTAEQFTKVRKQMRVPESEILADLRNELKARRALELLYSRNLVTPETLWEFYKQLNVRQSVEVAAVPVNDFVDSSIEPSPAELQALFEQYRTNFPGRTPEGRIAEGQPGFVQPHRVQIGYFEATADDVKDQLGEVTEEEIQKLYEDRFLRAVPTTEDHLKNLQLDGPELTPPATPEKSPAMEAPSADEAPANPEAKEDAKPAADAPKTEKTESAPATEKQEKTPAAEEPKAEPAPAEKETSFIPNFEQLIPVAFVQNETVEEKPATDAAAPAAAEPGVPAPKSDDPVKPADASQPAEPAKAEAPKGEAAPATPPEPKMEAKPAAEAPAADAPAAGEKMPAAEKAGAPALGTPENPLPLTPPPAPTSNVPPLDDALKAQLREQILEQRARAEVQKRIEAAKAYMSSISEKLNLLEGNPERLKPEDVQKKMEEYAKEHGLTYEVTPLLSYETLTNSEDFPIGRAFTRSATIATEQVPDTIFRSAPEELYVPREASSLFTNSGFAFWKVQDRADYAPITIDDEPEIREQVIKAWRLQKAEPNAKARAEELAKLVRESDKPMTDALSNSTVTGKEGALFLTVRETPEFTWMQRPLTAPNNFMQQQPVRESVIPGLTDIGNRFFETVFNKMKVGDVSVVPNKDNTIYYVVKVKNRTPGTPEQLEAARAEFLKEGMQPNYTSMMNNTLANHSYNITNSLFQQYKVLIPSQTQSEEM